MKKFMALILAVVMVLSLATVAFAGEAEYTIEKSLITDVLGFLHIDTSKLQSSEIVKDYDKLLVSGTTQVGELTVNVVNTVTQQVNGVCQYMMLKVVPAESNLGVKIQDQFAYVNWAVDTIVNHVTEKSAEIIQYVYGVANAEYVTD